MAPFWNGFAMRVGSKYVGFWISLVSAMLMASLAMPAMGFAHETAPESSSRPPVAGPDLPCLSPLIQNVGGLCCPGTQASVAPCLDIRRTEVSPLAEKLQPLYVDGIRIPTPIVLQLIKKALSQMWSAVPRDRATLVCRFTDVPGTRRTLLYCETNEGHFSRLQGPMYSLKLKKKSTIKCYYNCFLTRNNVYESLRQYVDDNYIRAEFIAGLLAQAPNEDDSYSLRMPQVVPMLFPLPGGPLILDYPVFVTYVIDDGDLADVKLADRKNPDEPPSLTGRGDKKLKQVPRGPTIPESPTPLCKTVYVVC